MSVLPTTTGRETRGRKGAGAPLPLAHTLRKLVPPLVIVRDMNTEPETDELCERPYCDELATAEDRRSIPVCQHHAEEDWAND